MNEAKLDLWVKCFEPLAIGVIKSLKLTNPNLKIIKHCRRDLNFYFYAIESNQHSEDKYNFKNYKCSQQ